MISFKLRVGGSDAFERAGVKPQNVRCATPLDPDDPELVRMRADLDYLEISPGVFRLRGVEQDSL